MKFTRDHIITALGETLSEPRLTNETDVIYDGAVFNSLEVIPGAIFVAIDGKKSADVRYVLPALKAGATCVVANVKYADDLKDAMSEYGETSDFLLVDDSLIAYGLIGKLSRDQFTNDVIGVIGSVGKTTTKNMLRELGGGQAIAHASRGSYNGETGVPLTLCAIPENAKRAIVEIGEMKFGDLTYLTTLAQPNILVITNVARAHTESLGDTAGVAKTLNEAVRLMPKSGTIVVPIDIDHRDIVLEEARASVIFIVDDDVQEETNTIVPSDIAKITNVRAREDLTHDFVLDFDGKTVAIHVPLVGRHFVADAALAIVASLLCGDQPAVLSALIENVEPQGHRMKIIDTDYITIVDDCYNANPASMKASMDAVVAMAKQLDRRCVFIMGPMRELGQRSAENHIELGAYAAQIGIDVLVCVDSETEPAVTSKVHPESHYFETVEQCCGGISDLISAKDIVGVKASRGPEPERPALVPVVEILADLQ